MKDKKMYILAIDDSPDVLELIKLSLETTTQWTVLQSPSAQDGLIKAQQYRPDIMLVDLNMPGMNGIEMVSLLRSQGINQNIVVLMLTSLPTLIPPKTIEELAIHSVIEKPFDWFSLADLVESAINLNNREAALFA